MLFWIELVVLAFILAVVLARLKSWRWRAIWFVLILLPFALPLSMLLKAGCDFSEPNGCYDTGWMLIIALGAAPIWLLVLGVCYLLYAMCRAPTVAPTNADAPRLEPSEPEKTE